MKPLGRMKNIKGCGEWKRSFFKIGNWWEEMTEPISNKSARKKLRQSLRNTLNNVDYSQAKKIH